MKKKFTLGLVLLLLSRFLLAAPPTVSASNLQFPSANLEGNRFNITFNKGNGAFRIIVVKEGAPVTQLPVNGVDYTANASYGTSGTEFTAADGFVVYRGSNVAATVTVQVAQLQPGTTYYVSVFEFNGTGTATEYLLSALSGNSTTKAAPTNQAVITSFTNIAGNRLTVNWSNGNGDRRLLVARKGAPVNAVPQNLTDYTVSGAFGSGNVIGDDNYVLYKGAGSFANITNLEPNTTYHFALFEYNGNNGPVYLTPGNTNSQTTHAGPTQASGTINFSNPEGNGFTISFGIGNGKHQLIIARKDQPVTAIPVNGQTYTANTAFGSGEEIAPGEFVLNSTGNNRTFTSMEPSSTYYIRVYEYDVDANGATYYLTSSFSEKEGNTATAPAVQASNVRFENVTGTTATLRYDPGVSSYRMAIIKAGSPVDAIPADLTKYSGNGNFGSGTQVTPGNYVINGGSNGSAVNITGLTPGVTYHVAVFGFNGNNFPVYKVPAATGQFTVPNEPVQPGTGLATVQREGNSVRLQWSGGDGTRRIVIAKKNSAVTATPADGNVYTASDNFGNGAEIAPGEYVVYNDVARLFTINNLEPATVYHIAVFEYNISGGLPDYLTGSFLAGNTNTVSAPVTQVSAITAGNIQNTQATIGFTSGDGASRLFIMRAGSPVTIDPQQLTSYSASTVFGNQEIGAGNYVVSKTSTAASFTVTGLSPNTQYYVAAYELNGTNAPVYLLPAATYDFTTTGSVVTAPTQHAANPRITSVEGNAFTFSCDAGNGTKRLIVMKAGSAVSFTPVNGQDYTANSAYGTGNDLGGGQFVVYNGSNSSVAVTNLQPSASYHFAVFEYNGTGTSARYLTAGALVKDTTTALPPVTGSSNMTGVANALTITINWQKGSGTGRIVVMKDGGAVAGAPVILTKYPANAVFQNGSQIAAGEYVVYAGTGNSVTVTGLENNKTYHYTIFEYNGTNAPVYNTLNAISGSTAIGGNLPLKWLYFNAVEENGTVRLTWGTTQEVNTSHFVIERSTVNGSFAAIDSVQAKGGSVRNDYHYTDNNKPSGTVVYRIKQVDIDGRYEYARQVVVQEAVQPATVKLYPNPATSFTKISLPAGIQQATVKLVDSRGVLVKTMTVFNNTSILLAGLVKGMYHVIIQTPGKQYSQQLLIQ